MMTKERKGKTMDCQVIKIKKNQIKSDNELRALVTVHLSFNPSEWLEFDLKVIQKDGGKRPFIYTPIKFPRNLFDQVCQIVLKDYDEMVAKAYSNNNPDPHRMEGVANQGEKQDGTEPN